MGNKTAKLSKEEVARFRSVTHFSTEDLKKHYKNFLKNYPEGYITKEQWLEEGLCQGTDKELVEYIFNVYDTDRNGIVDFKRSRKAETYYTVYDWSFYNYTRDSRRGTFNLYDIDNNGYIEREEMLKIVTVYFRMCQSLMEEMPEEQNTPEKRTDHLFKQMDVNGDGKITLQEFKKGVKQDSAILGALTVLG
ncbi:Calcium-binding protein NCS-1 [Balamuthia mandrillaris]